MPHRPVDSLAELGYAYLEDVFTAEQCQQFTDGLFQMKSVNALQYENSNDYVTGSYGGNCEEFEQALRDLTPRVADELRLKIKPANTYGRIYVNGGRLAKHVDRPGLDCTLSVSLKSTLTTEWPLYCIDKHGDTVALHIPDGDGGMMFGQAIQHWRDELACAPHQWTAKLFMHWSFAD